MQFSIFQARHGYCSVDWFRRSYTLFYLNVSIIQGDLSTKMPQKANEDEHYINIKNTKKAIW